jgi:iron complex outermembrane receptor protein
MRKTVIPEDAVSRKGHSTRLISSDLWKPRAQFVPVSVCALILGISLPYTASAETESTNALSSKLAGMSIEQLVNVEVVSINSLFKKETRLDQAPAAAALVTSDDIRRLGITTIPEALRLVPGVDVGRIDSHEWAISARGFDAQFANKLLILQDGRTIYGPAYGGVNWGMQDVMMEDLDRIEVIRGPGASLWGANAVNGVVNILSKSARDTQGFLVSGNGGTEDQPEVAARYGGQLGTNLYYRVYGKYFNRDGLVTSTGANANDNWNSIQGGTRMDWEPADESKFTVQGNYYNDVVQENQNVVLLVPPFGTNVVAHNHDYGGYMLGRWTRQFSESSELTLQTYYDHFKQEQVGSAETRNSFDFDGQYRFQVGERNDVIAGFQYYVTSDEFPPNFFLTWTPETRHDELFSAFVQDEITLVPERWSLTLGSKFEHNDYTGFEAEPNVRLLWTPTDNQTVWAAVSRAIRTPSRYETGARVNYSVFEQPDTTVTINRLLGNADALSEKLNAYELGYRIQPTKQLSFDLAGYYNQYDDLLRFVPEPGFMQGPIEVFPQSIKNSGSAETFGGELLAQWKVLDNWRLSASYSYLHVSLHPNDRAFQGNPQQMFKMSSYLDLTRNLEFNGALYYMDQQTAEAGLGTATIPSYVRLDLGLVWRPVKHLEVGIWGQNLVQNQHAEFPSLKSSVQTEIPREILGKVTLQF